MWSKDTAHMHTAFIEALNKLLTENLFKVQDAQEFNDPEKIQMTGMKPNEAIELK